MKKKLLASLLTVSMMLTMVTPVMAAPQEAPVTNAESDVAVFAGEGPEADTGWYVGHESESQFTIDTAQELAGLAALVNAGNNFTGKTITLGDDIDLSIYTNWQPIGNSNKPFSGTFDGQKHTIRNLTAIYPGKSDIGLFGFTTNGEVKNFTLENAKVQGHLDVGAVAGTPYTSKYTDITVKGLIQVDGYAYVGGALGKNAYANVTDVDVLGEPGSYVKADSEIYRTYVGGLVGFMAEGGHKVSGCDVKIDVTGSTCDVGGILGILHYGNTLENCTYEGNLKMDDPKETELGALVGVTMNNSKYTNQKATMKNCEATVYSADLAGKDVTASILPHGGFYNPTILGNVTITLDGTVNGKPFHIENKPVKVGDTYYTTVAEAIAKNDSGTITLMANVTENVTIPQGKTFTLDLNGKTLSNDSMYSLVVDGGKLTVTDSTAGQPVVGDDNNTVTYLGSGMIKNTFNNNGEAKAIQVQNGGVLNLQGGTVYCVKGSGIFAIGDEKGNTAVASTIHMTGGYVEAQEYGIGVIGKGATLTMDGGVVKARDNAAVGGNGSNTENNRCGGTTITINGGTLIGNIQSAGYVACGIYHPQEGTLTVNGGNIYVHGGAGIVARSGAATINNVNIVTTGDTTGKVGDSRVVVPCSAVVVDEDANYPGGGLDTDIKGGNFVSAEGVANVTLVGKTNDKLTVSGGDFSAPVPKDNLDDALKIEVKDPQDKDTPYSYYPSVEEALKNEKGDQLEMKDVTVTDPAQTCIVTLKDGIADSKVTLNKDSVFKLPSLEREGYNFMGWEDKDGDLHKAGDLVTVKDNVTFTAVWSYNGSSVKRYDVTLADTDNGSITATHKRASKNSTVTITATPADGYAVDAVTVTEKDGDKVEVTKKDDNKYTFKMPASDVTVKVTFKVAPTEPEQPSGLPFTDVAKDAWYFPAVEYVFNNGLMNGTTATTFAPNVELNRAMMAAVLYNMEGGPACDKSGLFSDVADGKWYTDAVNWAASNNIVSGMPDGTYAPDQALTREQMASVLYRYAEYKGIDVSARADLSTFTDGTTVSPWAQDVVQWAVAEKLMSGNGNELQPKGTASRAQVATVLMNYSENVAK